MAIAGGVAIGVFGGIGLLTLFIAGLVSLLAQKLWITSLSSIVVGFSVLFCLTRLFNKHEELAIGFVTVALMVLGHALRGHAQRRKVSSQSE